MSWIDIVKIVELALLVSVLWATQRGAPWTPTPMRKVHKMLAMADIEPDDTIYDLGCGDGRMVIIAARHYGARAVGIEIHPLRYLWCQMMITMLNLRDRVQIVKGDFFKLNLSDADVITCFLLPTTNRKLQGKLKQELHAGARVVSSDFTFPGLHLIQGDSGAKICLYDSE